ncbi:hypothetical protein SEA_BRYNNIE_61 [Arthrobacter phage Brynnie]|nr:hypothetical protein SEA_BRYNNIE_61 [Arthrobacter phage Brynnie]
MSMEGKPADVVIREDGTTLVRVERYGVAVLVNLEELRRPLVVGRVVVDGPSPSFADLRAGLLASAYVRDPGFRWGGVL